MDNFDEDKRNSTKCLSLQLKDFIDLSFIIIIYFNTPKIYNLKILKFENFSILNQIF